MAKLSSQFASISPDMNVDEATDGLVSVMKAFEVDPNNVLDGVMSKINIIGNTAATTNGEIVTMLKKSSSAMKEANNTLDETIALETAAVEIVRNADVVGTAFKTVAMRIRGYDEETEEYSEEIAELTGKIADLTKTASTPGGISLFTDASKTEYKSTYQLLKDISEIYDELTDKQQAGLLEALAGKRGGQVVAATLNNFSAAEKAMDSMRDSAGSADKEMEIIKNSIEYKVNELKETIVGMIQDLVSSDMVKGIVGTGTTILKTIDSITDRVGVLQIALTSLGGIMGLKGKGFVKSSDVNAMFGGMLDTKVVQSSSKNFKAATDVINDYNNALANSKKLSASQFRKITMDADQHTSGLLASYRGQKLAIETYNTSLLGSVKGYTKVNAAIENYNSVLSKSAEEQKGYIDLVGQSNTHLANYFKSLDGGSASFINYTGYLVTATAKTIALNVATAALNMGISMLASVAISTAIKAFDDYIHREENAIKAGEEAAASIKSISEEFKNLESDVNGIKDRFAELSQGVDQISGKNLSLNDDEYKEFLDLSNQLAELFPTLTRNYDDNGNAIVQLDENVGGIVGSLNDLVEVQRKLAREKIVDAMPDVFKGAKAQDTKIGREITDLENRIEQINDTWNAVDTGALDIEALAENYENGVLKIKAVNGDLYGAAQKYNEYTKLFKELGIDYSIARQVQTYNGVSEYDINVDLDAVKGLVQDYTELGTLQDQIIQKQKEQAATWNEYKSNLVTWVQNESDYAILSDQVKEYVRAAINSIDFTSDEFKDFSNQDFQNYILNNIIEPIRKNPEIAKPIEIGLDLKTQLNNGDISVGEFKAQFNQITDLIETLPDEQQKAIILALGINEDDWFSGIQDKISRARNALGGNIDFDVFDGLSTKQLDFILKHSNEVAKEIKASGDTTANGLIAAIQKVQESFDQAIDEVKAKTESSFADTTNMLNTQVKPVMDALKTAYTSMFKDGGFTTADLDITSTLESLRSQITSINSNEDLKIHIDYDGFDELAEALSNTSLTAEEQARAVQEAFNQMATDVAESAVNVKEAVEAMGNGDGLTDELVSNLNVVREALEDMGVQTIPVLIDKTDEMGNVIGQEIQNFALESATAETTAQSIALLQLQKMLAVQNPMDLSGDISYIMATAQAAGVGTEALNILYQALMTVSQLSTAMGEATAAGDNYAVGIIQETTTRVMNEAKEKIQAMVGDMSDIKVDFGSLGSKGGGSAAGGAKDAGKDAADAFKSGLQSGLSDIESIISAAISRIDKRISALNAEMSAALDGIQAQCDAAVAALEAERDAQLNAIQEEIDAIQDQIDAKNDEIDAINKAREARQRELDLQKAQYEYAKMMNQKTVLLYSHDKGMYYTTDTSSAREKKEEIDEIKEKQYIATIQDEIDLLEKEKKVLEERKEEIEEYYDKLIEETKAYYDNLKKETEAYYKALIENLEKQKTKFEELKALQEEAQQKALFERYGIDGEALLAGSEAEFEKLKNMYITIADSLNGLDTMSADTVNALSQIGIAVNGNITPSIKSVQEFGDAFGELGANISATDLTGFTTKLSDVETKMQTLKDAIASGDQNSIRAALEDINNTDFSGITTSLTTLAEDFTTFGEDAKTGFDQGLLSEGYLESINTYATNILQALHDGPFVFGSPSETMKEYGTWTTQGFDQGVVEGTEASLEAINTWAQSILDAMSAAFGEGEDGGGLTSIFEQLNTSIANVDFTPLLNNVQSMIDGFTNLQTAISGVSAAIGGDGGAANGAGGQGQNGSAGGQGASGGSLVSSMEALKASADTALGVVGGEGEGDGEGMIGQFKTLNTAVTDVTTSIGGGDEGSDGGGGSDGGTLISSVETLGDISTEVVGTRDEGDTVNGRFQEMSNVIAEAEEHVQGINKGLDELDGKHVTVTIHVNIETSGNLGLAHTEGVFDHLHLESETYTAKYGNAFASGTGRGGRSTTKYGLRKSEKNALRSEYGQPELAVYPNGTYELTTSPTMSDLPKGTVIFPEDETRKILSRGRKSNGRAFADGSSTVSFGGSSLTLSEIDSMASKFMSVLKVVNPAMQTFGEVLDTATDKMQSLVNKTSNNNHNTTIQIGDIHVHEVQDANNFAKVVIQQFPNALLQELHTI